MVSQYPAVRAAKRLDPMLAVALASMLFGLGVGLVAFVPVGAVLLVPVVALSLAQALFGPLTSAIVAQMAPTELRGRYMGSWTLIYIAGQGALGTAARRPAARSSRGPRKLRPADRLRPGRRLSVSAAQGKGQRDRAAARRLSRESQGLGVAWCSQCAKGLAAARRRQRPLQQDPRPCMSWCHVAAPASVTRGTIRADRGSGGDSPRRLSPLGPPSPSIKAGHFGRWYLACHPSRCQAPIVEFELSWKVPLLDSNCVPREERFIEVAPSQQYDEL